MIRLAAGNLMHSILSLLTIIIIYDSQILCKSDKEHELPWNAPVLIKDSCWRQNSTLWLTLKLLLFSSCLISSRKFIFYWPNVNTVSRSLLYRCHQVLALLLVWTRSPVNLIIVFHVSMKLSNCKEKLSGSDSQTNG